jgi:DNA invertase Pin-like site-specific DNA recombinase
MRRFWEDGVGDEDPEIDRMRVAGGERISVVSLRVTAGSGSTISGRPRLIRKCSEGTRSMSRPLRAARYHRVSRVDQDPRLQADETQTFIAARGWELAATFTDHGVSGSRERRPELDKLLAGARRRKFDLVVVFKADRLFRSLRHMVNTLDELGALGVGFVSTSEPFDTTTPTGKLLLHVIAAMGEFERGLVIERTRAGVAAARRRGVRLGRPPARLDVDELRGLRAQGRSVRQIAEMLHVGASTIQRRLAVVQGGAEVPS